MMCPIASGVLHDEDSYLHTTHTAVMTTSELILMCMKRNDQAKLTIQDLYPAIVLARYVRTS